MHRSEGNASLGQGHITLTFGNPKVGYSARPIFYAMMAVEQLAGSTLVASELDLTGANVRAYVVRRQGDWRIGIVNKDLQRDVVVDIPIPAPIRQSAVWRLTAPAVDATERVTLAGAEVTGSEATWKAAIRNVCLSTNRSCRCECRGRVLPSHFSPEHEACAARPRT